MEGERAEIAVLTYPLSYRLAAKKASYINIVSASSPPGRQVIATQADPLDCLILLLGR